MKYDKTTSKIRKKLEFTEATGVSIIEDFQREVICCKKSTAKDNKTSFSCIIKQNHDVPTGTVSGNESNIYCIFCVFLMAMRRQLFQFLYGKT